MLQAGSFSSGSQPRPGHSDSYSVLSLSPCGQMGLQANYSAEQGQGRDILGPTTLSLWTWTSHHHTAIASRDLLFLKPIQGLGEKAKVLKAGVLF